MSVKLCLTRALTCGPLHISAASLDPQLSPLQALAHLPQPNLFFFRFWNVNDSVVHARSSGMSNMLCELFGTRRLIVSAEHTCTLFSWLLCWTCQTRFVYDAPSVWKPIWHPGFTASYQEQTWHLNVSVSQFRCRPHTSLIPGRHVNRVYVIYLETGALTILLSQQQPQNINTRDETKPNCRLDWYLWRQLSSAKPPEAHTVTEMCLKTGGRSVHA